VQINPRESDVPPGHVALPVEAIESFRDIDRGFKPLDETPVDDEDKDVESTRGEVSSSRIINLIVCNLHCFDLV
jgi:hypothetical protein